MQSELAVGFRRIPMIWSAPPIPLSLCFLQDETRGFFFLARIPRGLYIYIFSSSYIIFVCRRDWVCVCVCLSVCLSVWDCSGDGWKSHEGLSWKHLERIFWRIWSAPPLSSVNPLSVSDSSFLIVTRFRIMSSFMSSPFPIIIIISFSSSSLINIIIIVIITTIIISSARFLFVSLILSFFVVFNSDFIHPLLSPENKQTVVLHLPPSPSPFLSPPSLSLSLSLF